ncbi:MULTISPECIES: LysM peptidoglycan-binding domain-containing protein [unclassified Bacillus (in: firmicutes)]|uniref:cell division suppressor protein YneA n=1 Tax=unclassified Bacillus (in: firmicutes) TaxID=185979 RepID=UPI0008EC694C|nr:MULTISPECIES: LysM peptidoglycan-binding domain-containing protein [unclassified Bacillus (in: firmicutes)]SFA72515.1 LysM domain-containing protein [Bacillus sp. UNCCL13]SFQ62707.1 LysM domain-containing protein [Bacillus sp. cl95]
MKKLWNEYSYAIILLVLSCLSAFIMSFKYDDAIDEKFVKVTISEGDSLWEIADNYSAQHDMSPKEFVQWVKKNNEIEGDFIIPGEELIIPIAKEEQSTQLAGIVNE